MTDIAAVVAAAAHSRGIGCNGKLPWRLPGDMAHFKKITSSPPSPGLINAVIMGRKTWESIPPKFRPLDGRTNVILSNKPKHEILTPQEEQNKKNVIVASSLEEATETLKQLDDLGYTFIIGGGQVYEESVKKGFLDRVYYTEVQNYPEDTKFDAWFPELEDKEWDRQVYCKSEDDDGSPEKKEEWLTDKKSGIQYKFLAFHKINPATKEDGAPPQCRSKPMEEEKKEEMMEEGAHVNVEEMQYLEMCRDIIENGVERGDRTGTGTLSKFGTQMRFSLRDGTLPLLTTKRTFWRGVAEELLWFVEGNTNGNDLAAKGIHIWDGNGSREFLDQRGLSHRDVGDLGPVYGFQWRHFGAKYVDMHTDYTGQGVDQLAECIDKIKNNPEDRRIIMSAWNPSDLNEMALPPCHMFCQFYVDTKKRELSCQMYQRSADMGLGVPFNIASYALLTHMIAHVTNLKPGDFVHTIGDTHVYLNHVDALKEQLTRAPRAFPKLKINPDKKGIDDFVYDDFEVIGYNPHKTIKMKMAV